MRLLTEKKKKKKNEKKKKKKQQNRFFLPAVCWRIMEFILLSGSPGQEQLRASGPIAYQKQATQATLRKISV